MTDKRGPKEEQVRKLREERAMRELARQDVISNIEEKLKQIRIDQIIREELDRARAVVEVEVFAPPKRKPKKKARKK
jgi:hypothetical protein